MARVRIFLYLALLAGLVACTTQEFPSNVHEWGDFNICVTRVSDTCHLPDGGCSTQQYLSESLPVGVIPTDGGFSSFLLARDPLTAISGEEAGARFRIVHNVAADGTQQAFCGCAVDIIETIQGQLSVSLDGSVPTCMAGDAGAAADSGPESCEIPGEGFVPGAPDDAGCTFAPPPASPYYPECGGLADPECVPMPGDAGDDCEWLATTDAGVDIAAQYSYVEGRIIDWVYPLDGGTCGCTPCMLVYDFVGSM